MQKEIKFPAIIFHQKFRKATFLSGHSGRHSQRNYLQRSQYDVNDDLNKYQLCSSHCSYPFWQACKNSVFLRFLIVGQQVRRDKRKQGTLSQDRMYRLVHMLVNIADYHCHQG
ncbi:hypothetical protein E2986_12154 [Frieseomelitta varia]|uniref:Uncharacterized protein n=1 Tax=Frieseomelitta varia TaxID=561572 RepID=A0A833WAM0_9HYME|nr:hypothetical protein E2986_12154 [Frieseomelitta varia]